MSKIWFNLSPLEKVKRAQWFYPLAMLVGIIVFYWKLDCLLATFVNVTFFVLFWNDYRILNLEAAETS